MAGQIYENCLVEPTHYLDIYGGRYHAQSFIPVATHNVGYVGVLIRRLGNCGTVILELQGDNSGKPNNVAISFGTLLQSSIPEGNDGVEVFLEAVLDSQPVLEVGMVYWLVVKAPDGTGAISNKARVYSAYSADGSAYSQGQKASTLNGGDSWSVQTTYDLIFAEYGPEESVGVNPKIDEYWSW
jgi:hypothetical protein